MTTKHKAVIGVAVVVLLLYAKKRAAASKCGPGAYWKTVTKLDGTVSGYCTKGITGLPEMLDVDDAPVSFDDFGNPLITRPSQL